MPNDKERSKRLAERLDLANIKILELEAELELKGRRLALAQDALAKLNEDMAKGKAKADARHAQVLEKLEQLAQAFSLHMNANTDAINILTAKLDFTLVGVTAPGIKEPTDYSRERFGKKDKADGSHS